MDPNFGLIVLFGAGIASSMYAGRLLERNKASRAVGHMAMLSMRATTMLANAAVTVMIEHGMAKDDAISKLVKQANKEAAQFVITKNDGSKVA